MRSTKRKIQPTKRWKVVAAVLAGILTALQIIEKIIDIIQKLA